MRDPWSEWLAFAIAIVVILTVLALTVGLVWGVLFLAHRYLLVRYVVGLAAVCLFVSVIGGSR